VLMYGPCHRNTHPSSCPSPLPLLSPLKRETVHIHLTCPSLCNTADAGLRVATRYRVSHTFIMCDWDAV
jgi:hypothetical protein